MSSRPAPADQAAAWRRWRMDSIEPGVTPRPAGKAGPGDKAAPKRNAHGLPTVEDIEALQDQAREEGYAEGYAQGRVRGESEAARMQAMADGMQAAIRSLEAEVADEVLTLALDIARQVVQDALQAKRELLLPVVREAMRLLPADTRSAQVLLNPADVELVRAHFGEELRVAGWQIVEDHRVQPGGCRITSTNCEVDATLATRWKRALAAIGRSNPWTES